MARYCIGTATADSPEKIALKVIDSHLNVRSWTFAELQDSVLRIAGHLQDLDLERGDRLLIRMENCPEYAFLFFAAIACGILPIPLSSQLSAREVDFIAQDSGASVIALSDGLEPGEKASALIKLTASDIAQATTSGALADWHDTKSEDPAYLIYTSGTTSLPKGVLHAHRAAWGRRPMYQGWYGIAPDDVMLHAGAFNWTYTLGVGLTDPWANGATAVVYLGPRQPDIWPDIIRTSGATIFAAVPTVYRQILKYCELEPGSLGKLRHGLTAGEQLPIDIATEWQERTGLSLFEAFGMSEISTYISCSPDISPRAGSPGKPQSGRRVAILDPEAGDGPLPAGETGVIAVHRSDPGMMLGYWNRPEEEAAVFRGDWFLTGDRASMDEDGYIWLDGRSDDLMNSFGYRVSPVEIETVLGAHPVVSEIAVAECEVRPNIRVITAFVVLEPDTGKDSNFAPEAELKHCAEAQLADYKQPREYVFVEKLPRTANGKLKRAALTIQPHPA